MTKQALLHIAPNLALPLDFITSTQAILAKKRVGKTYTAQVLAEELLAAGQQVVVIDLTSAWWGLRSSSDGKSAGYPITIFGGRHGDLPLEATAGEVLANAIVADKFSAVLDVRLLKKGQRLRFIADFLETLYDKNTDAMHLFCDEADAYCPQQTFSPEQARALGATDELVRRGGIGGIGVTLISQRAQTLNKNVLSQVDQLTVLRMNHPKDLSAIRDWIVEHVDADKAKEMMASLPSLPKGEAWVWAPEHDIFKRISVRAKRTYDSGRTPKVGEQVKAPKVLAEVDLARLGETIKSTVEAAKANDPKVLRARIAELEKGANVGGAGTVEAIRQWDAERAERVADLHVMTQQGKEIERLRTEIRRYKASVVEAARKLLNDAITETTKIENSVPLTNILADIKRGPDLAYQSVPQKPVAVYTHGRSRPGSRTPPIALASHVRPINGESPTIGGGLRRILVALAQRPQGLTQRQIGVRAGLSSKSGTFSTYLSKARSSGWIDGSGTLRITDVGRSALGSYEPLPTGGNLAAYWLDELGGGAARILRVLFDAYPQELTAETIGEMSEMSPKSGTYSTYVSKLRSLELVTGRGSLRASEELFT